ncbi:MAG: hypothetical protein EA353_05675 [Puniceicoccaceae bacterium]|nr:MAG: hypothetical protein EA353_05675 [Puniceicoccaceae bacterium]
MPEFEDENPNASQSQSYTPSTDASQKPRTRRRSGGFKTELTPISNAKIGEVSAADALKEEKLSGRPSQSGSSETRSERPRRERSERKPREAREPRAEREPREPRAPQAEREPRKKRAPQAPRTDANPQPSPETLAAIASVEAKINERKTERDARRATRDKNRPAKSERPSERSSERTSSPRRENGRKPSSQKSQGGLLEAIGGFFGKLFGNTPEPTKKRSSPRGPRSQNRGDRTDGPRSSQNRGRSGKGGGSGQGRKRSGSGNGPRRGSRRSSENVAS